MGPAFSPTVRRLGLPAIALVTGACAALQTGPDATSLNESRAMPGTVPIGAPHAGGPGDPAAGTGASDMAGLPGTAPATVPDLASEFAPGKGPGAIARPTGTIRLAIRWPERPAYGLQAIPRRTNSLRIRALAGETSVASALLVRPQDGTLDATASLTLPAGAATTILVRAYQEQDPAFDSTVIAEASASVDVLPATEVDVRLALLPAFPPTITSMPANAGPGTVITVTGKHFDGWGGPVEFRFGTALSPSVQGDSTTLTVTVPDDAVDGKARVEADGLVGVAPATFRVIRKLLLNPDVATSSVGDPVAFTLMAQDASNSEIPDPVVTSSFAKLTEFVGPGGDPDPPSSLQGLTFTPAATGMFEIRFSAGTVVATSTVEVE